MSKVAVYVRVSTEDQEKGIKSQEHAIEEYLIGHGLTATWYRDRLSAKEGNKRPDFDKLKKDIFNGKVKTVVCWKLDRLSRSLRDGINILCDWLDKDVRIVAVAQQLDFSGPTGKMVAAVLFALAEMERENIRENTKRGLRKAKAKGVRLGRPTRVTPQAVVSMLEQGMSVSSAAKHLGITRQAIYNTLKRGGITCPKKNLKLHK
jgi:DNA invertase Pin-like site-specific DNA recombinase